MKFVLPTDAFDISKAEIKKNGYKSFKCNMIWVYSSGAREVFTDDNGGASLDRYTVIFEIYDNQCNVWGKWLDKSDSKKSMVCLSLSGNPEHPQGFSQFGSCIVGSHLGKSIPWLQLSKNIQQHIKQRLEL